MGEVIGAVRRLLVARSLLGVAGAVLVTLSGALIVGSTALGWAHVTDPGVQFSPQGVVSGLFLLEGKVAFCLGLGLVPVGTAMLFAEDASIRRLLALVAIVVGAVASGLCAYTLINVGERTAAAFCRNFGQPGNPGDQFFQQACKTISDVIDPRVGLYLGLEASIASVIGGIFGFRARPGRGR